MGKTYRDRAAAGDAVAVALADHIDPARTVVLGLVRGGVPVAAAVAARLHAPLDVLVVRKLGVPWAPELAFGALGPDGVRVLNEEIAGQLDQGQIEQVARHEAAELNRRERRYRAGRPRLDLTGRVAVVVDDGLATGATARAAVAVARHLGAARVVVAVPVGSAEAVDMLRTEADEVICLRMPPDFGSVGRFYDDFRQVDDDEVVGLLSRAR